MKSARFFRHGCRMRVRRKPRPSYAVLWCASRRSWRGCAPSITNPRAPATGALSVVGESLAAVGEPIRPELHCDSAAARLLLVAAILAFQSMPYPRQVAEQILR